MLRSTVFASMIALAAATTGAARAEGIPTLSGAGDNAQVAYDGGAPGTTVGGGAARMTGSGQDRVITYGAVAAQPGRAGRLQGGGQDAQVIYAPAQPAPTGFARRATGGLGG